MEITAPGPVIVPVSAETLFNTSERQKIIFTDALLCIKNLAYGHLIVLYWYHADTAIRYTEK
jgi:hypothetical protein